MRRRSTLHKIRAAISGFFGPSAKNSIDFVQPFVVPLLKGVAREALPYLGNLLIDKSPSENFTNTGLEILHNFSKKVSDDTGPQPWSDPIPELMSRRVTQERPRYVDVDTLKYSRNEWLQDVNKPLPEANAVSVMSPKYQFGVGPGLIDREGSFLRDQGIVVTPKRKPGPGSKSSKKTVEKPRKNVKKNTRKRTKVVPKPKVKKSTQKSVKIAKTSTKPKKKVSYAVEV